MKKGEEFVIFIHINYRVFYVTKGRSLKKSLSDGVVQLA